VTQLVISILFYRWGNEVKDRIKKSGTCVKNYSNYQLNCMVEMVIKEGYLMNLLLLKCVHYLTLTEISRTTVYMTIEDADDWCINQT